MSNTKPLRHLLLGAILIALVVSLGLVVEQSIGAQRRSQAPRFDVDPLWPKPLPNHWVLGSVTGVAVDSKDHIWITHRGADSHKKGARQPAHWLLRSRSPNPRVRSSVQSRRTLGRSGPGLRVAPVSGRNHRRS